MRHRFFIACTISIAALAIAYTLFWFYAAGRAETFLNLWVEKGLASGLEVSCGEITINGFPFALNIHIRHPKMARKHSTLSWSWDTNALTIETRPWTLHKPRIRLPGRHTLLLGSENEQPPYTVNSENLEVSLHVAQSLEHVRLDSRNVSITHINWSKDAKISEASINWEAGDNFTVLDLHIGNIILPQSPISPLGTIINELSGRILVKGPQLFETWPESLESWRADGGTVEMVKGRLHWGPVMVKATGTVSLDSENRPIGAFDTHITGISSIIESLRDSGQLSSLEAAAINVWVNLLSIPGEHSIRIPATMQDGRFYIGGFTIGLIEPLF